MPSKSMVKSSDRNSERVMVFVDGSNLYHVLGQNCSRHNVHFDKLANKLSNGRDLKRTYYYNIRQEDQNGEQQKFLDSMFDTPYLEVKLGISKQRGEIVVEKGVDVMLATDLVVHAYKDHYDTAVVVSGDADFYPALQAVKDVGKHVEVAAFESNISSESSKVADVHIRLTKSYFTGLWMPKLSTIIMKKEISDEAASPNGEDKSRNRKKPTNIRRRVNINNNSNSDKDKFKVKEIKKSKNSSVSIPKNGIDKDEKKFRSTPSRRKIGGSSNDNGDYKKVAPPKLRTDTNQTEEKNSEKNGWLKKLGI